MNHQINWSCIPCLVTSTVLNDTLMLFGLCTVLTQCRYIHGAFDMKHAKIVVTGVPDCKLSLQSMPVRAYKVLTIAGQGVGHNILSE